MSKRRDQIAARFDAAIDKVCERASAAVEVEIGRTVASWNKRFPRHRFRAAVGHGMLCVECKPGFRGVVDPSWWRNTRGAAAVIEQEVQALIDWHCELDRRARTFDTVGWING